MGYFIDFWNMCSIMSSTKTKKCPHHPDSHSLGPLAGPLADMFNIKVKYVTLRGQESTSLSEIAANLRCSDIFSKCTRIGLENDLIILTVTH